MSDRLTFRYVNETAGAFVLIVLVVLLVLITRAAWLQSWLAPGKELRVIMPKEGSFGLREGGEIEVLGTTAGRVANITIKDDGQMIALIDVREDFAPFIRSDSEATIRKTYGIAGDTFLDVTLGEGEPLNWENAVIYARLDPTTTERLDATLDDLRQRLLPTIDELRLGIQKWSEVADYLREPERDFGPLLADMKAISSRIRDGKGTLGMLVANDEMAANLADTIEEIRAAAAEVKPLMERLTKVSEDAGVISGRLKDEAEQLPGLVDRLQQTLAEIEVFVGDLKQSGKVLPETTDSVRDAAVRLPEMIAEAEAAARSIRQLAESLRRRYAPEGLDAEPPDKRVAPMEATP
jgi:phospholipid/cholesterol/gamma-HCH transport system substrate-binding protein